MNCYQPTYTHTEADTDDDDKAKQLTTVQKQQSDRVNEYQQIPTVSKTPRARTGIENMESIMETPNKL